MISKKYFRKFMKQETAHDHKHSVSKKYFQKCLTLFEIFENYIFESFPLYSIISKSLIAEYFKL